MKHPAHARSILTDDEDERIDALAEEVVRLSDRIAHLEKSHRAWMEEALRLAEERDLASDDLEWTRVRLDEARDKAAQLQQALQRLN